MSVIPPNEPTRDLFEASLVNLIRTYLLAGTSRRDILEVMELRYSLLSKAKRDRPVLHGSPEMDRGPHP